MNQPQDDADIPDDALIDFAWDGSPPDSAATGPSQTTQPDALVEFVWRGEGEVAEPTPPGLIPPPCGTHVRHRFSPAVEQLIRSRLETGRYESEDDLILAALQSLDECDADLQAIQEALDSVDRGEPGTELNEACRRIRQKYGIEG